MPRENSPPKAFPRWLKLLFVYGKFSIIFLNFYLFQQVNRPYGILCDVYFFWENNEMMK